MGTCSCKSESDSLGEIASQNNPNLIKSKPDPFIQLNHGTINNIFEFGDIIGEGSSFIVRIVTNKQTNITRSMKKISKDKTTPKQKEDLIDQINIQKELDHPHIARIFEAYQDDNSFYILSEFIPGGELFERIQNLTNFSEKIAAELIQQILSALAYLHQMKLVHRLKDVKPEKIFVYDDNDSMNIKFTDFSTVKKLNENEQLTDQIGSQYYIAPEVLLGQYNQQCDIWSCGVILYILLCGYPPFFGNSQKEIFEQISSGFFYFNPKDWDSISEQAKDLISKMLTLDPQQRITASEALHHNWLLQNKSETSLDQKTLKNLSNFQNNNKFQSAIMRIIATQIMTPEEKEQLRKSFEAIDQNGDGLLTKDELYQVQGLMKVYKDKEQCSKLVEAIFQSVDTNLSGKVDFTEFIIAAASTKEMLSKSKIKKAFKVLDSDGNGFITREELREALGNQIDDQQWNAVIEHFDKNQDGYISQQEFIEAIFKK